MEEISKTQLLHRPKPVAQSERVTRKKGKEQKEVEVSTAADSYDEFGSLIVYNGDWDSEDSTKASIQRCIDATR